MIEGSNIPLDEEDKKLLLHLSRKWRRQDQDLVMKILVGDSTDEERDYVSDLVSGTYVRRRLGESSEEHERRVEGMDRLVGRLFDDAGWDT